MDFPDNGLDATIEDVVNIPRHEPFALDLHHYIGDEGELEIRFIIAPVDLKEYKGEFVSITQQLGSFALIYARHYNEGDRDPMFWVCPEGWVIAVAEVVRENPKIDKDFINDIFKWANVPLSGADGLSVVSGWLEPFLMRETVTYADMVTFSREFRGSRGGKHTHGNASFIEGGRIVQVMSAPRRIIKNFFRHTREQADIKLKKRLWGSDNCVINDCYSLPVFDGLYYGSIGIAAGEPVVVVMGGDPEKLQEHMQALRVPGGPGARGRIDTLLSGHYTTLLGKGGQCSGTLPVRGFNSPTP